MASEMVKIKPSESFDQLDLISKDRTQTPIVMMDNERHPRKMSLVLVGHGGICNSLPPLSPSLIHVLDESDSSKLHKLFKQVDTDSSGFIGLDEVRDICSKFGSNDEECQLIFNHLDKDGDGLVSFEDFTAGFNEYKMQLMSLSPTNEVKVNFNQTNSSFNSCSTVNDLVKNNKHDDDDDTDHVEPDDTGSYAANGKVSISSMTSDTGIGSSDSVTSEFGDVQLRIKSANNISGPPSDKGNKACSNLHVNGTCNILDTDDNLHQFHHEQQCNRKECYHPHRQYSDESRHTLYDESVSNVFHSKKHQQLTNSSSNITNCHSNGQDVPQVTIASVDGTIHQLPVSGIHGDTNSSFAPSDCLLESLIDKVNRLKEENQLLTASLIKDRKNHSSHLTQLEQEVECQVKEVEERAVEMVKSEIAAERKSLRQLLQEELDELHKQLQLFQKVDTLAKVNANTNNQQNIEVSEYKAKLAEANEENRKLKYSLMDAQTNLAIITSDLAQLKIQYDEKQSELEHEKELVALSMSQQDQLSRQICLLQEANQRLQDANDVRISMITQHGSAPNSLIGIETTKFVNGNNSGPVQISSLKRGSVLADYILPLNKSLDTGSGKSSSKKNNNPTIVRLVTEELVQSESSIETNSIYPSEDGHCSLCSSSHCSSSSCCSCDKVNSSKKKKKKSKSTESTCTSNRTSLDLKCNSNCNRRESNSTVVGHHSPNSKIQSKSTLSPSTIKQLGLHPSSCSSQFESSTTSSNSSVTPSIPPNVNCYTSPERTFKIILVGDAGVGKSSLIVRITKSKFDPILSSTLGVDFHVKSMVVNNQSVLLQLWDTAGQERFRCMTRSYFRKVDGILLMYDVSNEKTFMSVRSWMVDIKSNATSPTTMNGESVNIPVMLIGNKIDLRDSADDVSSSLFISSDAGSLAAREYGASAFAEMSVKSGDYVDHALTALVVKMMATEDKLIKGHARDPSVVSLRSESSGKSSWKDKVPCCSK